MTAALVLVAVAGFLAVIVLTWLHHLERREWADERRELVNRAIARHAGEVRTLDTPPGAERPHERRGAIIGLEG